MVGSPTHVQNTAYITCLDGYGMLIIVQTIHIFYTIYYLYIVLYNSIMLYIKI